MKKLIRDSSRRFFALIQLILLGIAGYVFMYGNLSNMARTAQILLMAVLEAQTLYFFLVHPSAEELHDAAVHKYDISSVRPKRRRHDRANQLFCPQAMKRFQAMTNEYH